jgi:hypothetical protein
MLLVATFKINYSFDFAHLEGELAFIVPNRNFAHIMVAFVDQNFSFAHIMVTFADQNFSFAHITVTFINHNFSFVRIMVVASINLNNGFELTYSFTDFLKLYFEFDCLVELDHPMRSIRPFFFLFIKYNIIIQIDSILIIIQYF